MSGNPFVLAGRRRHGSSSQPGDNAVAFMFWVFFFMVAFFGIFYLVAVAGGGVGSYFHNADVNEFFRGALDGAESLFDCLAIACGSKKAIIYEGGQALYDWGFSLNIFFPLTCTYIWSRRILA